jgi:hypothetical protein
MGIETVFIFFVCAMHIHNMSGMRNSYSYIMLNGFTSSEMVYSAIKAWKPLNRA